MTDRQPDAPTPLAEAAAAVDAGEWARAVGILETAAAERELTSPEVDLLARARYGNGDLEGAIGQWELLHSRCTSADDVVGAARAAMTIAVFLMMDSGLMAPVRGWTARAERLLADQDETDIDAWLAVVNTYERFMCGDIEASATWAARAIEVGERQGAPAPTAIGRVASARIVIFSGDVETGLRLLDEAAVSTVSGELDPLSVGIVYCELICAMQGLAQYDRAEEWTEAMQRWRTGNAYGGINGRCRVHRAEILRLRGSCAEAEEEALHAVEELRPWMRREFGWPLTELGTIRLRRGDLAGAQEAFLAAHERGWDPQPGLALLRLAQGDIAAAESLITHALDHPANIPSKERPPHVALRRAPLLDARAEVALAAGDAPTARAAATELSEIASTFGSRALDAGAALARGRAALAEGDAATAVRECEDALIGWSDVGAPYECATVRVTLARAFAALGDEVRADLEREAARTTLEKIGSTWPVDGSADSGPERGGGRPARHADGERTTDGDSVFRRDGDTRIVAFDGQQVILRDLKGMRYVARLLDEPGREFHVLDLVMAEAGAPVRHSAAAAEVSARPGGAGPALDDQAKEAYRRRLEEVDDDIAEAEANGDAERAALAAADREFLVRELAGAFGLGGRERPTLDASERARASVSRSIRYALDRVEEHHPALAEHLRQAVRTGTYCGYFPDTRVVARWDV